MHPEQTIKALELGAPIEESKRPYNPVPPYAIIKRGTFINSGVPCPTAEQMIGFLEEQKLIINLDTTAEEDEHNCLSIKWQYFIYNKYHDNINEEYIEYSSRKEAILAAIDAALEYLSKNGK